MISEEKENLSSEFNLAVMSDSEFNFFSEFVYRECGIIMPPKKKLMLTSRLRKRLKHLGMSSFKAYYDYITSAEGIKNEFVPMIDVVTTNKTEFFREEAHFTYLMEEALFELIKSVNFRNSNRLNAWSAGCSTGEEPYTLGIVLSEFFSGVGRGSDSFRILATDISTQVLESGLRAIYSDDVIGPVPEKMRKKYFMKGKGKQEGFFRVVPELRDRIEFRRLNFMDNTFNIKESMDIIFCRNVVIYFDKDTQRKLFKKFYNQLSPGGFMLIGNSETLHGINEDFIMVAPNTYRKPE